MTFPNFPNNDPGWAARNQQENLRAADALRRSLDQLNQPRRGGGGYRSGGSGGCSGCLGCLGLIVFLVVAGFAVLLITHNMQMIENIGRDIHISVSSTPAPG